MEREVNMQVTKKNKETEAFSPVKIVETLSYATPEDEPSLSQEEQHLFMQAVNDGFYDGISTEAIHVLLINHAKKRGAEKKIPLLLEVSNQLIMNDLHHLEKRKFEKVSKVSTVTKRGGHREPMDLSKLVEKAYDATAGVEGVSASELIIDSHIAWKEGITTEELQQAIIKTAVDKISEPKPNWTYVAARLFLDSMYHKVGKLYGSTKGTAYIHLEKYIKFSLTTGKYHKRFFKGYNLEELDAYIKPERDLQFTYLGIRTFDDRYAVKTSDGEQLELPQHAFMAIAMFLAHKEKDKMKWAKKFYDLISTFEVMVATPTLSNARLIHHQLSSCFVGSNDDSLEGIFDGYKEKAFLSKLGGGVGWDWSQVRAYDSSIASYKGVAKGLRPFIKIENDIAIAVDQLGTRNGAFADYIPDWHMDIFNFLKMRDNGGEERHRAKDIFPAIWYSDEFMRREANDEMWTLMDPYDVPHLNELYGEAFTKAYCLAEQDPSIRKDRVRAREVFAEVMQTSNTHGAPFAGFKDTVNKDNKNKHTGIIRSSNLCTEIYQVTEPERDMYDMTLDNGTVIAMSAFETITTGGGEKRVKYISEGDTIDGLEVVEIRKYRSKGKTAICNLASVNLPKLTCLPDAEFNDKIYTAIRMLDNVIDVNLYPTKKIEDTAKASRAIGLGVMGEAEDIAMRKIHFGSEEHVAYIEEHYDRFQAASIAASEKLAIEKGAYPDWKGSEWPNPMRNGYLNAIAPTSSISILTGTTSCFESVFDRSWYEENLSGSIPVTAPHLNAENYQFYRSAYAVSQMSAIEMNAIRTKRIDQGSAFNIFVKPENVKNVKYLAALYRFAWMQGLKSVYYVRSHAPEHDKPEVIDRSMECAGCQ